PAARRFGVGPTCIGAQILTGIARLCTPLAVGPLTVGLLIVGMFLLGFARSAFNINQVSLRQSITPDRLQGRVNATMRFIMWGVTPVGALLGGILGGAIGLQPTLLLAASGVLLAFVWAFFSPLRVLRE